MKVTIHHRTNTGRPSGRRIWWDVGWVVFSAYLIGFDITRPRPWTTVVAVVSIILWLINLHLDLRCFHWDIEEEKQEYEEDQ